MTHFDVCQKCCECREKVFEWWKWSAFVSINKEETEMDMYVWVGVG